MHQEKDELKYQQFSEMEIVELTVDEALCVAGGPEVENEPTR